MQGIQLQGPDVLHFLKLAPNAQHNLVSEKDGSVDGGRMLEAPAEQWVGRYPMIARVLLSMNSVAPAGDRFRTARMRRRPAFRARRS